MTTYRIQLNRKTAQSSICNRNESCAIQVSVGSKSYEGEKLADLLEWSAKRYHYIILLINDMPQRHNIGEHLLNAIEKVEDYGRKWIDRNQYILSNFSMLKIITSSTWLLHWQFKNVRECIHTAINNHSELNNAISHDTLEYHKRNKID